MMRKISEAMDQGLLNPESVKSVIDRAIKSIIEGYANTDKFSSEQHMKFVKSNIKFDNNLKSIIYSSAFTIPAMYTPETYRGTASKIAKDLAAVLPISRYKGEADEGGQEVPVVIEGKSRLAKITGESNDKVLELYFSIPADISDKVASLRADLESFIAKNLHKIVDESTSPEALNDIIKDIPAMSLEDLEGAKEQINNMLTHTRPESSKLQSIRDNYKANFGEELSSDYDEDLNDLTKEKADFLSWSTNPEAMAFANPSFKPHEGLLTEFEDKPIPRIGPEYDADGNTVASLLDGLSVSLKRFGKTVQASKVEALLRSVKNN